MIKIMSDNFIDVDVVAESFVSSEQAAYPVENVYNAQRRSKVWRSNGYWQIVSGDNTIVFRETGMVNLTATIAAAEYSSTTTFLAAIKTALEDVGASTYTVSQDATTNKIKIASNGAGGGGIFEIIWTHADSADMAGILGYSTAADDTGALTYTADLLRIHTSEWIKWDMGISTNPMAFILIGPRNRPIKLSDSAVIKLQGNETDAWSSPSYEATLAYNERAIAVFDVAGLHTEALRYWRLYIEDKDNPLGYVEIGAIFLGDYLVMERGAVQFPLQAQYIDNSVTIFSEGGQSFSDFREQSEALSLEWFGLTKTDKEAIDLHFSNYGTGSPFFVSLDPDGVFSSGEEYYIRLVKFSSPPSYSLVSYNNFAMNMDIREEL